MSESPDSPKTVEAARDITSPAAAASAPGLDLDAWRGDLSRLHGTIDQVVQSFITSQTQQLDAVAAELASQRERILVKERCFSELSDSIAGFVEQEAKRMEACGLSLHDPEADARHEAYDAELPGPQVLHRINRLWRKATRAFEAARVANEREAAAALEAQRQELDARVAEADRRCDDLRAAHAAELEALRGRLEASSGDSQQKASEVEALCAKVQSLTEQLEAARSDAGRQTAALENAEVARARAAYEWEAEREELTTNCASVKSRCEELAQALDVSKGNEKELSKTCDDQAAKLEQMRRIMDEQERELNQKIERVQQYVKERQVGALQAERKQQDAEKLAERWQGEVRRLQAERDKLAKMVLDLEGSRSGQASEFHGALERSQHEVATLREALRQKEEQMRAANLDLMQQRDEEYNAKVNLEKQRERDRSIALLKKKEQEVQIKDQQLKAARQRIQELESSLGIASASVGAGCGQPSAQSNSPAGSTRSGGSIVGRREGSLPPLPLSAR